MKKIIVMVGLLMSMSSNAADVYGLDKQSSKKLIEKYGKEVSEIEVALKKESKNIKFDSDMSPAMEALGKKRQALMDAIKKDNGYLFVNMDSVFYPGEGDFYSTIEIIDKKHPERMRFVNMTPKQEFSKKNNSHQPDIIDAMNEYSEIGTELMIHQEINVANITCPVYHCTLGFTHPKLKPFLPVFNEGVIKQRAFIIETLNHDPDPQRRAAAVFLVGHFEDSKDILSLLTSHIADNDDEVRNNVMRVIAETITKANITELDVTPFVNALDSPYDTDRNKALLVLVKISDSKAMGQKIFQQGGDKLVELLELKQPNNHHPAYLILKKISGRRFGANNLSAWRSWVSAEKRQLV